MEKHYIFFVYVFQKVLLHLNVFSPSSTKREDKEEEEEEEERNKKKSRTNVISPYSDYRKP